MYMCIHIYMNTGSRMMYVFIIAWCAFLCIPLTASYICIYIQIYMNTGSSHSACIHICMVCICMYFCNRLLCIFTNAYVHESRFRAWCRCWSQRLQCTPSGFTRTSTSVSPVRCVCVWATESFVYVHSCFPTIVCTRERVRCVCTLVFSAGVCELKREVCVCLW